MILERVVMCTGRDGCSVLSAFGSIFLVGLQALNSKRPTEDNKNG